MQKKISMNPNSQVQKFKARRNLKILRDFFGSTSGTAEKVRELAKAHHVCEKTIYIILKTTKEKNNED